MAVTTPKKRKVTLNNVPEEIYTFLLKEQNKVKEKRKISQFSIEQIIYCIIRSTEDFKKCKDCK